MAHADDPDAPVGTWVQWVIYDIPATVGELTAGLPPKDRVPGHVFGQVELMGRYQRK